MRKACAHTHVRFIFESIAAARSTTMKMSCFLIGKDTSRRVAIFRRTKSLESFLNDRRVFAMVVGVHLNVRCADVHLAAAVLQSHSEQKCNRHCSYRLNTYSSSYSSLKYGLLPEHYDHRMKCLCSHLRLQYLRLQALFCWALYEGRSKSS